ncbi:MAG: class I SAM-dependent methyltransferase [Planctomycetia bacterium]|nr:class I SAM-dependent methyltransferase [Planctomycetia bacterium]
MTTMIERFFAEDVRRFTDTLADLDRRIGPSAQPRQDELLKELTLALVEVLEACRNLESRLDNQTALVKEAQFRFREAIAPWFSRSWFIHRALVKPRGYAGDSDLLAAIYDGVPKSVGIGGYLDLYFFSTKLGRAVPARLAATRQFLLEELSRRSGKVSILNVASGPCREYAGGFPGAENCEIHLTCVDIDPQALEFVQQHVGPGLPPNVELTCVAYNALRMASAKANLEKFGPSDIIYSIGLCDYISDRTLVRLLEGWRESLAPGGVVFVAFKDGSRYRPTKYHWLDDWFFYQRTEADCRSLLAQAGYDVENLAMSRDATGIIMNFVSRRLATVPVRIDANGHPSSVSANGSSGAPIETVRAPQP